MAAAAAASGSEKFSFEQFEALCGMQLVGSGVPRSLWPCIYSKLKAQTFDAGDVFALAEQADDEDGDEDDGDARGEDGESKEGGSDEKQSKKPYILVTARDLTADDIEEQVWLLDHAWTFRAKEAAPTLFNNEQLRKRVKKMLLGGGGDAAGGGGEEGTEAEVNRILSALWPRVHHYCIASETQVDEESCWYLLDEVGTAIERIVVPAVPEGDEEFVHDPADFGVNVALVPLFYPPAKAAFSIVWFVDHDKEGITIEQGDIIACDAARGIAPDKRARSAARYDLAFEPRLDDIIRSAKSNSNAPGNVVLQRCEAARAARVERLTKAAAAKKGQLDEILKTRAKILDDKTAAATSLPVAAQLLINGSGPARVWTDHSQLREHFEKLNPAHYVLVEDPSIADIVWSSSVPANPRVAPNTKYVCEFHNENSFCNKLLLAQTMESVLGSSTDADSVIVATFDANRDLDAFVGHYVENSRTGKNNMWISKPHCLARSMDMSITDDLHFLLRIGETGHKILCSYIDRPFKLRGRKCDLRMCALVRNFSPDALEVYLHDKVWVRTAAQAYEQKCYFEYEKHFTVNNYGAGGIASSKMLNLLHDDFIREFDADQGGGAWARAYEKIKILLRKAFTAISIAHGAELEEPFMTTVSPPQVTDESMPPQAPVKHHTVHRRALYGLDLMLDENLRPYLIEINFSPDINRACKFFPTFVPDVFKTLFVGQASGCERLL